MGVRWERNLTKSSDQSKELWSSESGRATAPPGVCYTTLPGLTSEGYSHTIGTAHTSANLGDQSGAGLAQSQLYSPNINSFIHQRSQVSPCYSADYSPCPSPNLSNISKTNLSNLPFHSSQYSPDYSTSLSNSSVITSSSSNFSSFNSPGNNNINSINSNSNNNNNNNNFEFPSTSKTSTKSQPSYTCQENLNFSPEQNSSALSNYSKTCKSNSFPTPKYTPNYSNFSFFSNNQPKLNQSKESVDSCSEKNSKLKKDLETSQKPLKSFKDDTEINYNIEELQQFLSKHGTKIKNTQESSQDLVTDSLLHFLHKKTPQDNFSYDLGDISQILVSLTSKYKSDQITGFKKKENDEDCKLMNDFLTKIILEKEDKRLKAFDEKKKTLRRETFDDLSNELDERKIKRDAMSHYQEDKNHHKRPSNYGDFNQWDYLGQQDIQPANNHSRRGHYFGGTSQPHAMGWNPMGMGMPRQANPYYSNPHGHVMPAHAHSEYRYNQWNNPNHKNVPNIHNAHSQNTILPQTKMDMKHHADISNSVQDFGLPAGPGSEFSKLRASSRDMMLRPAPPDKSSRPGIHPDHIASITSAMRNPSLRTPPPSSHPKTVVNNPLSDLQSLVATQEKENPPQKRDSYQQESVDLSAHSEATKENSGKEEEKSVYDSKEGKEFRSSISVIQTQSKPVVKDFNECEKPVELTSKGAEKSAKTEIPLTVVNNLDTKEMNCENVDNEKKNSKTESKSEVEESEKPVKTSVIVEKDGSTSVNDVKDEGIPNDVESTESAAESKGNPRQEDPEGGNAEKEERKGVQADCSSDTSDKKEGKENSQEPDEKNRSDAPEIPQDMSNEGEETSRSGKRKATEEEVPCESKKASLEVESQSEDRVEGGGEDNSELPTVTSTSTEVKMTANESSKKAPKKKPSRKSRVGRMSSGQSSSSESHFPSKKHRSSGVKEESRKKMKKSLCDVMDRRGPILHIEGSKESPISVTVINFPKGDDEDERDKNAAKKQTSGVVRTKHHNELDYRGRSRNGLFSSTLSSRYDAQTTDHTWVCVFCKKGPHYNTLGDLFGPYLISKEENNSLCDFSGDEKDISDAQKRGGRNKKSLRSNNMVEHFQKMSRKLRRIQSTESCLTGMTVISDDQVDQLRYEVWVHEQCAVWSPNVCLIGSRIIGMQEAIWSSVKTMCSKCGAFGANIGCVYRNCPNRSHYYCAKESGWSLEQETFISTCHIHKPRS